MEVRIRLFMVLAYLGLKKVWFAQDGNGCYDKYRQTIGCKHWLFQLFEIGIPLIRDIQRIHGAQAPIPYHECGVIPDPDLCSEKGVFWSWWMLWHTDFVTNYDKEELKRIYNHKLVLTLGEFSDIMKYK